MFNLIVKISTEDNAFLESVRGAMEDYFGEDFILLGKLRNLGYKVFIDTQLSMKVKHVGNYAY